MFFLGLRTVAFRGFSLKLDLSSCPYLNGYSYPSGSVAMILLNAPLVCCIDMKYRSILGTSY